MQDDEGEAVLCGLQHSRRTEAGTRLVTYRKTRQLTMTLLHHSCCLFTVQFVRRHPMRVRACPIFFGGEGGGEEAYLRIGTSQVIFNLRWF